MAQGWVNICPVYAEDGSVVVFDMYVDGEWHGSRRTMRQVKMHLAFVQRMLDGIPHRLPEG